MIDIFKSHFKPNVLILGNLGSGKTSLAHYLLDFNRDKSVIFSPSLNGKLNINKRIAMRYSSVTAKTTNQLLDIIEKSDTIVFDNIEVIPKDHVWLIKRCLDDQNKKVILTSTKAWQQPYEEKLFHDISREEKINGVNYLIVGKIAVNAICDSIFQNYQNIYLATRFTFSQEYKSFLYYKNNTFIGQLDLTLDEINSKKQGQSVA